MKRTLAIVMLSMLLIATVGTTAASAYTSPIYTFIVKTDTGRYTGAVVVNTMNTASPTYSFTGYGLKPGATYYLYYTTTTGKHAVGSAVANWWGRVSLRGSWLNPVADLTQKPTFTLSKTPPAEPLEAIIVVTDSHISANGERWEWNYTVKTKGDVASGIVDVYAIWAENAQPTESIPLSEFPSQKTISAGNNVPSAVVFEVEGLGGNTVFVRVVFTWNGGDTSNPPVGEYSSASHDEG